MKKIKINLRIVEFELDKSDVKNHHPLIIAGITVIAVTYFSALVLHAIPNINHESVFLISLFLSLANSCIACVCIIPADCNFKKLQFNFSKTGTALFCIIFTVLSVACAGIFFKAAGCHSSACEIQEGAVYLVKKMGLYAGTVLFAGLVAVLSIHLLIKLAKQLVTGFKINS